MAIAAVLFALVWFLTAFVLRIGIQVRSHHDTGLRINAGPSLSLGWWARLLFTASMLVIGAGPVLVALGAVELVSALDSPVVAWTGLVMSAAGIALTFWCQLAMGASWRIGVDPDERTALVTGGPFSVVRNPIFSTMALTGVGLTLMAPSAVGLVGLVMLVIALEIQVRAVEEPYLRRVHGEAYEAYLANTGRFVPRRAHPELES